MAVGTPSSHLAASPVRWRRSARRLTPGQVALLREAFSATMGIGDERGYNYFAGLHGLPRPMDCTVAHGRPFFLPWHRAYLYFFERALRDQVPEATLTWWDWRTPTIPAIFAAEQDPGGQRNPLHSAPVDPVALQQGADARPPVLARRWTERDPGAPGTPPLPTAQDVQDALAQTDYSSFTEALEELHNRVHLWVGGRFGHMRLVEFSSFDPIFWAHHTMVDRIWRLWQLSHPGARPPASILRTALSPFPMTVEQTLDTTALGYDYAVSTSSAPTP
ncbi:tyrosinase family protein [Modestobacter altitudinis]|uniref:tyrosinase family protein n=1 Tax=Modestobacter altitudinis TaxID=2213158 RepID=UPI0014866FEA|nr:tyrosinase family protein [Modestobacter altitudinis]